ncbi:MULTISPECIES: lantibiotic dehydratase C-terminal domain-containing protein [unclassified Arthrobacter]|uniref:lantibiotic dehydratase C-terminal domain-containing protein n=1 Tax=unclassified Arthrobacter TaxID=235627 RepID=UPI001491B693|nr:MULTISPECIES: lantibiotic dehydratase C-terminal domain-containing protein [unclassified Arthrobacter]MBE0010426.1 hypothetical protein [Arthrobacter sp. AET 35A]NOJ59161.1 hypothetical protein [Arthrobacter sp. 260]NOJ64251.1 hypothetical protein [Arthrobacter sp. 147(2020)]
MSQLTAVRIASRTADSAQWWHLSVFTGGFDVADGIIGDLVTPLAAQAQKLGASRWFFTRCEEPAGAHVQLHVLACPAVTAQLQSFLSALQHGGLAGADRRPDHALDKYQAPNKPPTVEHGSLPGHHETSPAGILSELRVRQNFSRPAGNFPSQAAAIDVEPRLEAELVKYGGVDGLQLAEEVFELSSELAAWATKRFPKMQSRSAFGALILFDSARAMMKGPRSAGWPDRRRISWDFYWDSHLRTCTADLGPRSGGVRDALSAQVAARVPAFHGLMAATASESAAQNWRRRYARAIDNYLYRADKMRVSRSAQHLTVYQAHMTLNRLGFTTREEGVLGLYARSWSIEREAASYDQN